MYDVALSFAGEDRDYVEIIAKSLKDKGVDVFYDKFKTAELWGKDLYQYLNNIYKNEAKYCIVFISKSYQKKAWTKHELASAQNKAFLEDVEYILPIYIDNVEIPGINQTTGYISTKEYTPDEIVGFVLEKLEISNPNTESIDDDLANCKNLKELLNCAIKKIYKISDVDFNQIALSTVSQQHSTNLYVVADMIAKRKYRYNIITMWGVIGQSFRTGKTIYIKNVQDCDFYVDAVRQTRSEFVVPIKTSSNTVGVINIESEKEDFLNKKQIKSLEKLSADLGTMLERLGYEIQYIDDLPTLYYYI